LGAGGCAVGAAASSAELAELKAQFKTLALDKAATPDERAKLAARCKYEAEKVRIAQKATDA